MTVFASFCNVKQFVLLSFNETQIKIKKKWQRFYNRYEDHIHGDSLRNDLYMTLLRETGWEAVMRIRVSTGIQIKNYLGVFYRRTSDLLLLPTVDESKTYGLILTHCKQNAIKTREMYVQCALLYTDSFGKRKICVHTIGYPITASHMDLFTNVNINAMLNIKSKEAGLFEIFILFFFFKDNK